MSDMIEFLPEINNNHHKKCRAYIAFTYEDECKRTVCFETPVSIEVFAIAAALSELEKQENKNKENTDGNSKN